MLSRMNDSGSSTLRVLANISTSFDSPVQESVALKSSDTNGEEGKHNLSVAYKIKDLVQLVVNTFTTKLLGCLP